MTLARARLLVAAWFAVMAVPDGALGQAVGQEEQVDSAQTGRV